jgi:tetratricopeptide (TPR) repeat protein
MKKWIFCLPCFSCLTIVFPVWVSAQSVEQLYKAATEKLNKGEYYTAAAYFQQALEKDDSPAELWYGFAEASRLFNDYKNAAKGYEKAIKIDKEKSFPLCNFWLGCMWMNLGNYDSARQRLIAFQETYRNKDFYEIKAQQLIESCSWAMANSTAQPLTIQHLPDSVNSTFSEINPFLSPDGKFFFSSTKPIKGKLFRTQMIAAENGESFLPGISETSAPHVANGCFSNHPQFGEEIFFTQCHTESGATRCKMYVSKREKNQWQPAKELPAPVNLTGSTATHPSLLNDANGNQWLFFASDRPGTKGKMDIWYSKRLGENQWELPQNAGNLINSIDDEVTPFADAKNNQLYFSSLWHYGYGGFDIYSSEIISLVNNQFSKPKNLGKPINSSANELYFVCYDTVAFFSSNRMGSKFIEAETCCNDIYLVDLKQLPLIVTRDNLTQETQTNFSSENIPKKNPFLNNSEKNSDLSPVTDAVRKPQHVETSVVLYFHNDEPNPKSLSDTTEWSYIDAYESYINLQYQYISEFTTSLPGSEKAAAEKKIRTWFADTVEANFSKLISLLNYIENALTNSKTVNVKIYGYCSPLNYNEYNLRLGNRRANSVFNFLYHYKDGAFQKFIQNGKLKIEKITRGEEMAAPGVSDRLSDLRNSVYSLEAARERRVEISVSAIF